MPTLHIQRFGTKQNAKTWANQFRARILEPGIVSYEDQDCGKALLKKETLDRCIHSFVGRPLILARDGMNRPTFTHAKVSPATLEKMADGYISNVEYDPVDGWWYAVGTVHNEEAKQAIKEVGYVSCAYDVLDVGPGGSYHNIPYHEEITAFEGEHLAIVANPRYEHATIRLNAKTKPIKRMFKWIKNMLPSKQEAGEQKQNSVESGEIPEGAALEVDGKPVPVADLVKTHQRVNSVTGEEIDGASEIEVNGERVTLDTLIASHQKLNAKKNEVDEKKEEKKENASDEKKDEEKKENASEVKEDKEEKKENATDEKKEEKDGKENAVAPRTFKVNRKAGPISEARENGITVETSGRAPDTIATRLQRGVDRYGPKNVIPAK